jgi:hypothetical protein
VVGPHHEASSTQRFSLSAAIAAVSSFKSGGVAAARRPPPEGRMAASPKTRDGQDELRYRGFIGLICYSGRRAVRVPFLFPLHDEGVGQQLVDPRRSPSKTSSP